ncbi:MAG: hypothetical protein L7H08_04555 [Vulcanisaeta sp.]|nr:hypothetical protein [Vulcanisaeta sp.]
MKAPTANYVGETISSSYNVNLNASMSILYQIKWHELMRILDSLSDENRQYL